jgi:hypothetical protein
MEMLPSVVPIAILKPSELIKERKKMLGLSGPGSHFGA